MFVAPIISCAPVKSGTMDYRKLSNPMTGRCGIKAMHIEKTLEELYNVRVERNVSKERLA